MYSLRIDATGFEKKNGRRPNPEEEKNMIIETFENNKDTFNGNKEKYDATLKEALEWVDSFHRGEWVDTTNERL